MIFRTDPFVSAVIYADIFDYPLTRDEVWEYAVSEKPPGRDLFNAFLSGIPPFLSVRDGYYFLKGREEIVQLRQKRDIASKKKLQIVRRAAAVISRVPSVRFVGVSGGLARGNADTDDDIDIFIIARQGTIWQTRLYVTLLLTMTGMRRKRQHSAHADKICVNMLIDDAHLLLPAGRQDVYSAHEIAQVIPLISKDGMYREYIKANAWIQSYLPNKKPNDVLMPGRVSSYPFPVFPLFEQFAKTVQLWYMRKHRTNEEISEHMLAFHPEDYRAKVLSLYAQKLKQYEKI